MTYPNGSTTIAISRASLGGIDQITRGGTVLVDYAYVGSRVKNQVFETGANDVTGTPLYDGVGRMTRLTWSHASTVLPDFSYRYDSAGNILTKTHEHMSGDPPEDYLYDSLHRLTKGTYGHRTSDPYHGFIYDDLGNQLTFDNDGSATSYLHNDVNEITKVDATQMYYDPAGNLTKDQDGYTYHYDYENQLTSVKKTNDSVAVASYTYDALDRRIEFIDSVNTVTKRFYHSGQRVLEEYNAAGTPARQRYYVWGNYIDELLVMNDDAGDDSDYFVCRDHLFSPQTLVDSTGAIVERYDYDVYGQPSIYTDDGGDSDWWDGDETTATASAKGLPYLFTGREYDSLDDGSLPLQYSRARYYSFALRRWLQRDPVDYEGGINLYEYVRSSPINFVDPTGNWPWTITCVKIPEYENAVKAARRKYKKCMKDAEDFYTTCKEFADRAQDACVAICMKGPPIFKQWCIFQCGVGHGTVIAGCLATWTAREVGCVVAYNERLKAVDRNYTFTIPADECCPEGYGELVGPGGP